MVFCSMYFLGLQVHSMIEPESGFFSLKNHGVDKEVAEMFEMGEETMALPLQEKLKYEQGDEGIPFGCAKNLEVFGRILYP